MQTIIGVDIGGTLLRAARFDLDLNMLERVEQATQAGLGQDAVLGRLYETIRQVLPDSPEALLGIGVSTPGPLDTQAGIVITTPNLPFTNFPLAEAIHQAIGGPVFIGNDADLAALAEHQLGAGQGINTMIYLTISTGIGGGIIINGDILTGNGQGGEVGHMVIVPGGPLCGCGHPGHLEAVASGTAIARIARERLEAGESSFLRELTGGDHSRITAKLVGQAMKQGDPLAGEIITQAGRYIGMAMASLMALLNPQIFVMGGGMTRLGNLLFDPIREAVQEYALHPRYWENTPIVLATLGSNAGLYGAAALVRLRQKAGGARR